MSSIQIGEKVLVKQLDGSVKAAPEYGYDYYLVVQISGTDATLKTEDGYKSYHTSDLVKV